MSAFAGIFSPHHSGFDPNSLEQISAALLRQSQHKVTTYRDDALFLTKFDVLAFQEPAWEHSDWGVACLAGDPVWVDDGALRDRQQATQGLHRQLLAGDDALLLASRGTFCGIHYSFKPLQVQLVTDKLGIRPLYYCWQNNFFYFSSCLRVLETLSCLERRLDVAAAIETASFDYCLDDRTGYLGIHCLGAGQVLTVTKAGPSVRRYWQLPEAVQPADDTAQGLAALYQAFDDAVRLRRKQTTQVNALLSGGLDSRCVVTALWHQQLTVNSFTYAAPNTLDARLSQAYADQLSIQHQTRPFTATDDGPGWPVLVAQDIAMQQKKGTVFPRQRLVWTGDGGSGLVGRTFPNLTPALMTLINTHRLPQAINAVAPPFTTAVLAPAYRAAVAGFPTQPLLQQIQASQGQHAEDDGLRALLFHWVDSNQRRHLHGFYEAIDRYGIDLALPFYDAEVARCAFNFAPHSGLFHGLYHDWLKLFPTVILQVSWQHYPHHLPSPLPLPSDAVDQWSERVAPDPTLLAQMWDIIRSHRPLFNKPYLLWCLLLTGLGVSDRRWLFSQVSKIQRLYQHCDP